MAADTASIVGAEELSLAEKLDKIRSPKLQSQRETGVVLSAVEETLKDQSLSNTPTSYFAALLALLSQSTSPSNGIVNKELATSVAYLLDLVVPYVSPQLLRSKFTQILTSLVPVLTQHEIEAPLIRSSIGCLESLLIAQDGAAWALPQSQLSPRRAVAGLLVLAADHRPKVRKRAQEAITHILQNPPPSPSLDHPTIDMCAETALRSVSDMATPNDGKTKKSSKGQKQDEHQPGTIHALQLVKTIASASGGWPSKKIEPLCEILMQISRSQNEFLTMIAFEIFEVVFAGMADEVSSAKLPRLMEAITELRPNQNDSQLLPPWIAVISRGYDVSSQVDPQQTFQKLPELFDMLSGFLASSSHNIRISTSECLISFLVNCVPDSVILEPSVHDEKAQEKLAKAAKALLSIKYQSAWMEVFTVLSALFSAFKWRSVGLLDDMVIAIGDLRANNAFTGKKEADAVLGDAVAAMGPEAVLKILPLNLAKPVAGQPGRAWLLPILRDHIQNAHLAHFRSEFVPLSEVMFQRVLDHGSAAKTMEIKIFETLVQQIWALLPGYCAAPLDLTTAFDRGFGEMLGNLLYSQTELRRDICKALQTLVESNQAIVESQASEEELLVHQRMTKLDARKNIDHLSGFAGSLLAVLFNVYSRTLPQYRGYILQCINCYLGITQEKELLETFSNVVGMLESALKESQPSKEPQAQGNPKQSTLPPASHTLTDLLVTLSSHLPPDSYPALFSLASSILPLSCDPQLQKKAYKLLPRLATSPHGAHALHAHNVQLQDLLLSTASTVTASTRRDRLAAIAVVVEHLPATDLSFIPTILSEVVLAAKEVNEKARTQAFDLLVLMARRMHEEGGIVIQSRIPNLPASAPSVPATLSEFFTMVSAGLAGTSPHTISASITALTRILYAFASVLDRAVIDDLVQTMDLFLASANREIVRSTLGFVKVAVISLPEDIVRPRLQQLVPSLMAWSREHKARFRAKVKHILERMMRRFGAESVERYTPEDDRKFVHNIRKAKERSKRHRAAAKEQGADGMDNDDDDEVDGDDDDDDDDNDREDSARQRKKQQRQKGDFDSAYDDALAFDSDDSDSDSAAAATGGAGGGRKKVGKARRKGEEGKTYITESTDEPLDLLSRSSLAHISSRKPVARSVLSSSSSPLNNNNNRHTRKHKVDLDGKLIIGGNSGPDDDDAMVIDGADDNAATATTTAAAARAPRRGGGRGGDGADQDEDGMSLEQGVNAYVDAIRGRDAVQRGRAGRLKFSNKREKKDADADADADMDMDIRGEDDAGGSRNRARNGEKKQVRFADGDGRDRTGGKKKFSNGGSGAGGRGGRGGGGGGGAAFRTRGKGGIASRVERRPLGSGGGGGGGRGGSSRGRVAKRGARRARG